MIIGSSVFSGAVAEMSGGNFLEGFVQGVITTGLNHALSHVANESEKEVNKVYLDADDAGQPKGFDESEFKENLRNRLLDNGFSDKLSIEDYSMWDHFVSFVKGEHYAVLTLRMKGAHDGLTSGGHAKLYGNKGTIFYSKEPSLYTNYDYYSALALHEFGHAIFGFGHFKDINNIMHFQLKNIHANFNNAQLEIVRNSLWGR